MQRFVMLLSATWAQLTRHALDCLIFRWMDHLKLVFSSVGEIREIRKLISDLPLLQQPNAKSKLHPRDVLLVAILLEVLAYHNLSVLK